MWVSDEKLGDAYRRFAMDNVVDKYVTVTNTGKSDAYVRTIIALEMGAYETVAEYKYNIIGTSTNAENGAQFKFPGTWVWEEAFVADIDGNNYMVMVATHKNAVKPNETTIPSLLQIYMNKNCGNEEVKKVDGNGDGKFNVLVLSQAMQTEGFENAKTALNTGFGEATAEKVAEWFGDWETWKEGKEIGSPNGKLPEGNIDNNPPKAPNGDNEDADYEVPADAYRVTNATELTAAVANGKTTLLLAAGEYDIDGCIEKKLTLVGEDAKNTVIVVKGTGEGEANGQLDYGFDSSTVTFQNLTIKTNNQTYAGYARLVGTYKNVTFENCYCLNSDSQFENCTFNVAGNQYNLWTWGAPTATFTNCTFNSDGKAILIYGQANTKLTLTNCVFNDNGGLTDKKTAVEIGNDYNKSYELIVNNVEVNGYEETPNGIKTGSTLWSNKNSMSSDNLNVVIDGDDVY